MLIYQKETIQQQLSEDNEVCRKATKFKQQHKANI